MDKVIKEKQQLEDLITSQIKQFYKRNGLDINKETVYIHAEYKHAEKGNKMTFLKIELGITI